MTIQAALSAALLFLLLALPAIATARPHRAAFAAAATAYATAMTLLPYFLGPIGAVLFLPAAATYLFAATAIPIQAYRRKRRYSQLARRAAATK